MSNPFVALFLYFQRKKVIFFFLFGILMAFMLVAALRLDFKEDITAFIPKDAKAKKYQEVLNSLRFNDKLILNISLKDSSQSNPDALIEFAEKFNERIFTKLDSGYIKEINYKIEEEKATQLFDALYQQLPYYLTEDDYVELNRSLSDSAIDRKIKSNKALLLSNEGAFYKKFILKDPLGLNNFALKKIANLQINENSDLYNGYYFTKNHKNLFMYITIGYSSKDSKKNEVFLEFVSKTIDSLTASEEGVILAEYFGSPAVSDANIKQIKQDSIFTTALALVVILVGLFLYFKNIKTIALIFLPVLVGAVFSLSIVYLIKGEISAIAIGAGSIVLGIAIDYSLHFFTHFKHENSVKNVLSDLTIPLTIGCTTTVGAFFCLQYMQSEALQDMGLFAGFSLLGAALCCLIVLPHLINEKKVEKKKTIKISILDRISGYAYHKNKVILLFVVLVTAVCAFYYSSVGFETDMTKLSYVTPKLQQAENKLDELTQYKLKSVFLISNAPTLQEALVLNRKVIPIVKSLQKKEMVQNYSSVDELMLTPEQKKAKIAQWNIFWTKEKIQSVKELLLNYGASAHFKEAAFQDFFTLLNKDFYSSVSDESIDRFVYESVLNEFIQETSKGVSVVSILKVNQENKPAIYKAMEAESAVIVFDRGSMAAAFAKILNEDFNLILLLCSVLVVGFLTISYGRFELAFLAFLPMLISWIWILGFMGLFNLKFNIVNIILCTFIFGLGDDYSIFTLDGLEQKYKYGKDLVGSYRNSIFLSAFTTLVGIGVLLFAQHPALKSIALVTIIGITSIVFVSLVVQPLVYDWMVLSRKNKGRLPVSLYSLILLLTLLLLLVVLTIPYLVKKLFFVSQKEKFSIKIAKLLAGFKLWMEVRWGEFGGRKWLQAYLSIISITSLEAIENEYQLKKRKVAPTDYWRGALMRNYIFKGPLVEWYSIIKTKLEDTYKSFDELVPKEGKIIDVGCGYGYLSYVLSLTSDKREVIGIDYDQEKIDVAQNGVLKGERLTFVCSDVTEFEYQVSDTFIISDVLHYLREEQQQLLIRKCLDNLKEGGVLIIRDGNSELEKRHKGTKLTEFFSTKLIGFNKVTIDELCFTSKEKIEETVKGYPVNIEVLDTTQFTSNIVFVIKKNK